jgi:hypothetical protein
MSSYTNKEQFAASIQQGKTIPELLEDAKTAQRYFIQLVQDACIPHSPSSTLLQWVQAHDAQTHVIEHLSFGPFSIADPGIKTPKRAADKIAERHGKLAEKDLHAAYVTDYLRVTVQPKTVADKCAFLERLANSHPNILHDGATLYGNGFINETVLVPLPDGVVGEIKIMAPEQYKANQFSHRIYELMRQTMHGDRSFAAEAIDSELQSHYAQDFNQLLQAIQGAGYDTHGVEPMQDTPPSSASQIHTAFEQLRQLHRFVHMQAAEKSSPCWRMQYLALAEEKNILNQRNGKLPAFDEAWIQQQRSQAQVELRLIEQADHSPENSATKS